jgi:hypothetical protein
MSRSEIVEVAMPDGTVINAEVLVRDSLTDVGAQRRLSLGEARESIGSFIRWMVDGLGFLTEGDASGPPELKSDPPGMTLNRVNLEFGLTLAVKSGTLSSVIAAVGGEATAVVRLEWERAPAGGQP